MLWFKFLFGLRVLKNLAFPCFPLSQNMIVNHNIYTKFTKCGMEWTGSQSAHGSFPIGHLLCLVVSLLERFDCKVQ